MKISDYRDSYYLYSGKVSDITRQMALAGIAVVWIFKESAGTQYKISNELLIPSIGFLIALAFDLIQYVVGAVIWKRHYRELENQPLADDVTDREDHDFGYHQPSKELPLVVFFWLKVAVTFLAWFGLLMALIRRITIT
jgi:hypothetical protein